jgi:hypothetical protein
MNSSNAFYKCYNKNYRILELESIIATDPYYSYMYPRHIIKGRWEEGEKSICTHPEYSYLYARHVLKGPFHLCHPIIFNSKWKENYIDFLKFINYDLGEIAEWLI